MLLKLSSLVETPALTVFPAWPDAACEWSETVTVDAYGHYMTTYYSISGNITLYWNLSIYLSLFEE